MSARVLNDAQFAGMVNDDGASRHLHSMVQGPQRGYYVSLPTSEGTGLTVRGREATSVDVSYHRRRSQQAVKGTAWARNPELYQGGWNSGSKVDLDVSERVGDIGTALRKGHAQHQEAVYDANRGGDIALPGINSDLKAGPQPLPTFHDRRADHGGLKGVYRIQADKSSPRGWSYA
jgi:hypothetical protein